MNYKICVLQKTDQRSGSAPKKLATDFTSLDSLTNPLSELGASP